MKSTKERTDRQYTLSIVMVVMVVVAMAMVVFKT